MSTFMAKANEVDRKWYIIDAAGKPLGRVASEAARLLRGKHKPIFTPHVDTGDHVIILNAEKIVLTGKKMTQKLYYHHSRYPGGMKLVNYATLLRTNPERAMEKAIKGMLPKNRLGAQMYRKLKVYQGSEHPHQAQQPEVWNFGE
ncbi:50S ribosomal protein L13 [Heliobacillus mobilis]|uniref:Large ribosomal subunit protein uL13 n=2 Tax=Heliobacterium TaxID=2697 RepID=A0A6I3SKY6_HELMO|nr:MULTISPECIES: 50S ribosomal protein L13 [Heliobacterium]MBC9785288.1 50S ribosomal protein L13 [Heliobacterium chlorum]MTV49446.1 50S ribosomal protein L13 [Heliobacterium mobile]